MNESYKVEMVRCKVVRDRTIKLPSYRVEGPSDAVAVMHALTDDLPTERFVVIHMSGTGSILAVEVVSQGGAHGAALTAVDVFRGAVVRCATSIVIGHNHPSGDPTPSRQDISTTEELVEAGKILGIHIVDHIIVSRTGHVSLLERGVIK